MNNKERYKLAAKKAKHNPSALSDAELKFLYHSVQTNPAILAIAKLEIERRKWAKG